MPWSQYCIADMKKKKLFLTFSLDNLFQVWMEHLSAEISSNGNIILWRCRIRANSSCLLMSFHFPLDMKFSRWSTFSFCGYKLHTFPFANNGTAGWHQLHRHSRHFTGITSQRTLFSVWPWVTERWEKVVGTGEVRGACLQPWQGKNAEISMKAEQNSKIGFIRM